MMASWHIKAPEYLLVEVGPSRIARVIKGINAFCTGCGQDDRELFRWPGNGGVHDRREANGANWGTFLQEVTNRQPHIPNHHKVDVARAFMCGIEVPALDP